MSKPAKVKKMSEKEATSQILDYMNAQNRPYNSKQVFENIHGKDIGIGQASVTKIMDDLITSGKLASKLYKNKPIYWASQERFGETSDDTVKEMEKNIKTLRTEEERLSKLCIQQQRANARLAQTPLNANLDEELEAEQKRVAALRDRLDKMTGSGKIVDPHEKARLEKRYADARKEWISRKRKFTEICDTFEENGALDKKKVKKLKDELGIDDDESAGVSLANTKVAELKGDATPSVTTQPPNKRQRT